MKSFRRLLPHAAAAVFALTIAAIAVWFRLSQGPERVQDWWQAWREHSTAESTHGMRPVPFRLDDLAPGVRERVGVALHDHTAAFAAFNDWQRRYARASFGGERDALVGEGVAAAEMRREILREVIAIDPALALRLAVSRRERTQLPAAIVALLEEPVSGRGDFRVVATFGDGAADDTFRPVRREAEIAGRTYDAYVYGRRQQLTSSSGIGLHGIALDGRLALLDSPVRLLEPGELPATGRVVEELCAISGQAAGPDQGARDEPVIGADTGDRVYYLCSAGHIALLEENLYARETGSATTGAAMAATTGATGTKRVLFIRLRFADDASGFEPQSASSVQAMAGEANTFFQENSFGAFAITAVVTPVYTLPRTADWYKTHDTSGYALNVLQAGRQMAAAPAGAGNEGLAAFDYLDYDYDVVRYNGGPGAFSGQAYVGVRGCWIKNGTAGVLAHELGHNLGLWHANYWEPDDDEALVGSGRNREYGDDFDTMGRSNAGALHFNTAEKARLGWLPEASVTAVFASGTQRVFAHDRGGALDPAARYALRVPRGDDREYWFEFRQHAGWGANPWMLNGLGLRWNAWSASNGGTQLIDATPGSPDDKEDGAIVLGRTYSDAVANIHVTPLRKNGTAPESLDVDVQIGPFPGNRAPTVQLSAAFQQVAVGTSLALTASASDADGDALAYAWDFGDRALGTNTPAVSHRWNALGDHRVRVTVSDRKGATASASVVVRVGSATGSRVSGTVVDLAGQPVADVRIATALGSEDINYRAALTDSDGTFTLTGVANGTWGLTATKPGWAFAPLTFADPLVVAGDDAGVNFLGRAGGWRVTGVVRYADGTPVAGALVSDGVRTEPTNESGAFALVGVPVGFYTLQATAAGAQFAPVPVQVAYGDTVVPAITENTYSLSGEITGAGTTPITVTDGWRTTVSTMVGSGSSRRNAFVLEGVPAGVWHLRATAPDGTFSPVTFANPVQVIGDRTGLVLARDEPASAPPGVVRGQVRAGTSGVVGASVEGGGVTTSTDNRGGYMLAGVPTGATVVRAAASGLSFVPASREVIVGAVETDGIDFAASRDNAPPQFTQAPRTSGSLNRPFVKLSARATDDGGDALVRYTWAVVGTAPGSVGFSVNGALGAAETVAQFGVAGTYRIRVTASDAEGASASSEVTVTIGSAVVRLAIVPAIITANIGEPVTIAVQCVDQFGAAVTAPADVTWAVNGGGSISRQGVFNPTNPGRGFVVTARMGGLSASGVIDVGYARGPGYGLTRQVWSGITGGMVRQLTSAAAFPSQPGYTADWEGPLEIGVGESTEIDFGQRLRGFFVPPATGDYVFRIASSTASELWLSPGSDPANRVLIASTPVAVGFRQWTALSSQSSAAVRLTKDASVYIEVLHKAGAEGGAHLSVGVELPGGVFEGPIPGHRLLPWGARAFAAPVIVSPARATPTVIGSELVSMMDVTAASEGGENALSYTWSVQGSAPGPVVFLPNGNNAAKHTTARFGQPGRYHLVVTVVDAALQSTTSSVVVTVTHTFTAWQHAHFSAADRDDPAKEDTTWGTDADPDGDGVANLLEYAFGFDPQVPDAEETTRASFIVVGGVRYLAITFRRNLAAADVVFTPQATSNLQTWEVGLIPVGDPDAAEVTYRDFAPAENFEQRYLRVEVTVP